MIRNLPLLLQLLFWYNAVLKALPRYARQLRRCRAACSSTIAGWCCRQPIFRTAAAPWRSRLSAASSAALVYRFWARRRQDAHRAARRRCWRPALALVVAAAARGAAGDGCPAHVRVSGARPFQHHRRHRGLPEFAALLFGLIDLHRRLHRRSGARRHPGGADRPDRGGARARACVRASRCGLSCCRRRCASSFRR